MFSTLRRLFLRIVNALRPGGGEADLARELASHRRLLEDEYTRRGLSADEARRAASRALGPELRAKEQHREARAVVWLDDLRRDVLYALRMCRRSPGFTLVAVLTLALGIGANTAIFSVVRAVVLQPLPYKDPDRLVRIYENVPPSESPTHKRVRAGGIAVSDFLELREKSRMLSHVTSPGQAIVTMLGTSDAVQLNGSSITEGTFAMLGVPARIGRWFTPEEERSGDHVLMLSDNAWRKYFDADADILHRRVSFTGNSSFTGGIAFGASYSIVGVMPPGFHYPWDPPEFWIPAVVTRPADGRGRRTSVIAQLAPGASIEAATAEITAILGHLHGTTAASTPDRSRFELGRVEDEVSGPVRPALFVLSLAVGFVLLIACANVANMMLARASSRRRELTIRAAIGAGRGRLARQTLTESAVLGALGGAAGMALAVGGLAMFRALGTGLARFDLGSPGASFPRLPDIAVDRVALAFALIVSLATSLLFGVVPALHSSSSAQLETLRDAMSASNSGGRKGRVLRSALVVGQIAMALVLLVAGVLLITSFVRLTNVDPGYDITHVLTFQIGTSGSKYSTAEVKAFADDVVARVREMPKVSAAGYARQLPMVQLQDSYVFATRPQSPDQAAPDPAEGRYVSAGYLQAIGARLVSGRWPVRPREVLVNRTLARREFGAGSALGRTVFIGRATAPHEVVGVVEDERLFGLDRQAQPQFFADLSLWTGPNELPLGPYFAVRTTDNPETALAGIRDVVRRADPEAPLYNVATLEQIVANSTTVPRMYAVLVGIFAAIAVSLAAIGIYGVMAYTVSERTREIGIRMALGAQPRAVLALVLGQCGALTLAGLVVGIAGAAAGSRYLEGLLFGVTPFDPATIAMVAAAFAAVACAAAFKPARRATSVDPAIALRCE